MTASSIAVVSWVEQLAAQVLEEPQGLGGHGEAGPAAAGPVEHDPHDTQECSPGSRPMTFTRRRVSPKVRSMKFEWRMRRQCYHEALALTAVRPGLPPIYVEK